MPASKTHHLETLAADITLLKSEPTSVGAEQLQTMKQHLQTYNQEHGSRDRASFVMMGLLHCITALLAISSLGFVGAAVLWALDGTYSRWLVPLGIAGVPLCVWAHIKTTNWADKVWAAGESAAELKELLKPWTDRNWERAKVVSSLCAEAETYFAQITAEKAPMQFQLIALHRLANVLTPIDEWVLEEEGECEAPRTARYLHQHPNWTGNSAA